MSDDAACCACINVKYAPTEHGDGTFSERWVCLSCGARFTRTAFSAALRSDLARAKEERDRERERAEKAEAALRQALEHARADALRERAMEKKG